MPAARKTEMPQATSGSTVNMQISDRKGPRAPVMHRHRQLPNRRLAVDCLRSLSAQATFGAHAGNRGRQRFRRRDGILAAATPTTGGQAGPRSGAAAQRRLPTATQCRLAAAHGSLLSARLRAAAQSVHGTARRDIAWSTSWARIHMFASGTNSKTTRVASLFSIERRRPRRTRWRRAWAHQPSAAPRGIAAGSRAAHECDWSRAPA